MLEESVGMNLLEKAKKENKSTSDANRDQIGIKCSYCSAPGHNTTYYKVRQMDELGLSGDDFDEQMGQD